MIRYLDNQEKALTKSLWREAFPEDSEEFLDNYDQEKMTTNQVLVREENEIQAMLHLNPYRLLVRDACWNVDYIVAVATKSTMRHRGYMRSLLLQMMHDMRKKQMPFCFLMPAAEAIYTPFQFTFIYDQPVWKLKENAKLRRVCVEEAAGAASAESKDVGEAGIAQKNTGNEESAETELENTARLETTGTESGNSIELAADWMQHWLESRYEVFAKRDAAYVKSLVREVQSELGKLELLYDGEQLVGIQGIWGREKKEQRLLYTEDGYSELEGRKPAIMARIITPEMFVPVIRLKQDARTEQLRICLELEDPLIPQNAGRWVWTLNHTESELEKLDGPIDTMEEALARTQWDERRVLHLRIEEFTAWLFGYRIPEAVRAYPGAEQIDVLSRVFLDEVV